MLLGLVEHHHEPRLRVAGVYLRVISLTHELFLIGFVKKCYLSALVDFEAQAGPGAHVRRFSRLLELKKLVFVVQILETVVVRLLAYNQTVVQLVCQNVRLL